MLEFVCTASIMSDLQHYLSGWTIVPTSLLILGIGLMIVEMITPGLGAAGICGALALIGAIALSASSLLEALVSLLIIVLFIIAAGIIIFRSFNKGKLSKSPIMLDDVIDGKSTSVSDLDSSVIVGKRGIAINDLRPVGYAEFDGKRLDVVTHGEFIKKGDTVTITAIDGLKVIVEKS